MKLKLLSIAFLLNGLLTHGQQRISLTKETCFILAQYEKVEYGNIAFEGTTIPNIESYQNFYVDVTGASNKRNIVDINYLFLRGFDTNQEEGDGELVYLIMEKPFPQPPDISLDKVYRYDSLAAIKDVVLGYWSTKRIRGEQWLILAFRDKSKISSLKQFRVFSGTIEAKNIYLKNAMNPKDANLFNFKFSNGKQISFSLPVQLDQIFFSEEVDGIQRTIRYWPYDEFTKVDKDLKLLGLNALEMTINKKGDFEITDGPQTHVLTRKRYKKYYDENSNTEAIDLIVNIAGKNNDQIQLPIIYFR